MTIAPKFKWLVVAGAATVFVASWLILAAGFFLHPDVRTWTVLVMIAAIASELFVWSLAAALGLKMLEARRKIWEWVTRRERLG